VAAAAKASTCPDGGKVVGSRPLRGGYGSRLAWVAALAAAVALAAATGAGASKLVGLTGDGEVTLAVDESGVALIVYTNASGVVRRVLARGEADASLPGTPQRVLQLDYAAWRRASAHRDACRPYDGPPLVHLVAACKAPDGSYWALQRWQRVLPLRGVAPFRPEHRSAELRVAHWTGPLAQLEVFPNWTYGGALQGLFGRLTYRGEPLFGTRTPSATRSDVHARYVYIDTLNSAYGPGWRREAAKVTHLNSGGFCYSFAPIPPPPGYPDAMPTVPGVGERHRATVVGPGLTPDIQWEGPALGSFDPGADERVNRVFDELLAGDRVCAAER
jgi:hypothetical protein